MDRTVLAWTEKKESHEDEEESLVRGKRGLEPFRRRRPYDIIPVGAFRYELQELSTGEYFGSVNAPDLDENAPYFIDLGMSWGPQRELIEWNTTGGGSALAASDTLWRYTYPVKSRAWRLMRGLVHAYDWAFALVSVVARVALIVAVVWFVLGWVGFLWDARELVQDIVLQWLEAVRGNGERNAN